MMGETPIVRMANQIRSMEAEIEQLRADLDLRNQTALDRKKAIVELEAEIDRLRAEQKATLQAVLYHFGPEGANKLCTSVLEVRGGHVQEPNK